MVLKFEDIWDFFGKVDKLFWYLQLSKNLPSSRKWKLFITFNRICLSFVVLLGISTIYVVKNNPIIEIFNIVALSILLTIYYEIYIHTSYRSVFVEMLDWARSIHEVEYDSVIKETAENHNKKALVTSYNLVNYGFCVNLMNVAMSMMGILKPLFSDELYEPPMPFYLPIKDPAARQNFLVYTVTTFMQMLGVTSVAITEVFFSAIFAVIIIHLYYYLGLMQAYIDKISEKLNEIDDPKAVDIDKWIKDVVSMYNEARRIFQLLSNMKSMVFLLFSLHARAALIIFGLIVLVERSYYFIGFSILVNPAFLFCFCLACEKLNDQVCSGLSSNEEVSYTFLLFYYRLKLFSPLFTTYLGITYLFDDEN